MSEPRAPADPPSSPAAVPGEGALASAARAAGQAMGQAVGQAANAAGQAATAAGQAVGQAAGMAADATIKSATFTGRILAWLLARMPMRQIIYLGIGAVVSLILLIVLIVWVLGWLWHPQVDLGPWRQQAEQSLSQAAGRTVTIADAQLTVGRSPELRVRGLRIANAPGFSGQPLLSIDEAVLKVDATELSHASLSVRQASLRGVRVSLENKPSGNNWTLVPPGKPNREKRESFLAALPLQTLARLVVDEARIDQLIVNYTGIQGQTESWVLPQSVLQARAGQPVQFTAQGERCAKGQACSLLLTAGSLSDLARIDAGALQDWPVNLTLSWGDRILALFGNLQLRSMRGLMSAAAPRIEQDLADAGVKLRGPLAAGIGADFELTAQTLNVRSFTATFGPALVTGDWQADWTLDVDARPSVKAAINIAGLDDMLEAALPPKVARPAATATRPTALTARSGTATVAATGSSGGLRRFYESLGEFEIDPTALRRMDGQMRITMAKFDALGVQASGSEATVTLVAGQFSAPVRTTLWGAAFNAELQVDASQKLPTLQLDLLSRDAQLGPLARGALNLSGVEGHTGQLKVALATRGDTLAQWLRALDLSLRLDKARASYGKLEMDLGSFALRLPSLKPLSGSIDARVLGRPLQATLSGSTLEQFMRSERSALALAVRSDDLTLDLDARIAAPGSTQDDELAVRLRAPRAVALASWFGFDPNVRQVNAPLALDAQVRRSRIGAAGADAVYGLSLSAPLVLSLGHTELKVQAAQKIVDGRSLIDLDIAVPRLEVGDIDALMPARKPAAGNAAARGSTTLSLDVPILPQRLSFGDADVALHVNEVLGTPVELKAIEFRGQMRDGHLQAAPLSLLLDRKAVSGALSLDLRSEEPEAGIWLAAQQPDITHLARRLGVNTSAQLQFDSMSVYLLARSSRLGDMLARSELVASVDGGRLILHDAALGRTRTIDLSQGTVASNRGGPVSMSLKGRVEGQTATLTLSSASITQLIDSRTTIPLTLRADLAAQWVEVSAQFARSLGSPEGQLRLRAGGERLDQFNSASGLNLPPWGPWSLDGALDVSPGRYELGNLRLGVGGSVLTGSASVAMPLAGAGAPGVSRPTIRARLRSPLIQLDDFPTLGWSALSGSRQSTATMAQRAATPASGPAGLARLRAQALRGAQAGDAMLASGTLERYDIDLELALASVMSARERLGGAEFALRLRNGDLLIDPARVELPGGSAQFRLSFTRQPAGQRRAELNVDVANLDYGVLASRLPREGNAPPPRGKLSLRAQAAATTPELDELLERGTGRIDLMLWPQDMSAEKLDVWVSNLLTSLLPVVDKSAQPHVNCAVIKAQLDHGILRPQTLILDTTGMRVRGKGTVNLIEDQYALRFEPQGKEAQFFSLATPVAVTGPLNKPKVELSSGEIAQTVLRFATSMFWVPIMKLAGEKLPADGSDVCVDTPAR